MMFKMISDQQKFSDEIWSQLENFNLNQLPSFK